MYTIKLNQLSKKVVFIIFTVTAFLLVAVLNSSIFSILLYVLTLAFLLIDHSVLLQFMRKKATPSTIPLMLPPANHRIHQ